MNNVSDDPEFEFRLWILLKNYYHRYNWLSIMTDILSKYKYFICKKNKDTENEIYEIVISKEEGK